VPNILNIIFCVKGLWIENILTNNANAFRISHKLFLKPTENCKPARECICIHGIHGSYIKVAFRRRKSECGLLGATVFVSLGTGSWNLETVTAEAAGQTIASQAEFFNFLGSQHKCNLFCRTHRLSSADSDARYKIQCRAFGNSATQLTFMSFWQLRRTLVNIFKLYLGSSVCLNLHLWVPRDC